MSRAHLAAAITACSFAWTGGAVAQVFPPPDIEVAIPSETGPSSFTATSPNTLLSDVRTAIRVDLNASSPAGSWVGLLGYVEAIPGTAAYNYDWLKPVSVLAPDNAADLENQLASSNINAADRAEISGMDIRIPASRCKAMIDVWLADQYNITECAQFVSSGSAGQVNWVVSTDLWREPITSSGIGAASLAFWRPTRGGVIGVDVGGTTMDYTAIDPAALAEALIFAQAPSGPAYNALRNNGTDFRQLMESGRVVIQAIVTQPNTVPANPVATDGLPVTAADLARLTFSQPVIIDLGAAGPNAHPLGCPDAHKPVIHPDPLLVEFTGLNNPPYLVYPDTNLYIFVSHAYPGIKVRFPLVDNSTIDVPAYADLPGVLRVHVPDDVDPTAGQFTLVEPICLTATETKQMIVLPY